MLRAALVPLIVLACPLGAAGQQRAPSPPPRRATIYSCMTPPAEPLMVAGDTPPEVERLHPGYAIERFRRWSVPGLSLWLIRGRRIDDSRPERSAHVVGFDGQRVISSAELFRRARIDAPYELARRALETVIWRADQLPVMPRDAPELAPALRQLVSAPFIRDGTLYFWARRVPGQPSAEQLRVDLDTGRANVGAVW